MTEDSSRAEEYTEWSTGLENGGFEYYSDTLRQEFLEAGVAMEEGRLSREDVQAMRRHLLGAMALVEEAEQRLIEGR